jgi:hypothetical protein
MLIRIPSRQVCHLEIGIKTTLRSGNLENLRSGNWREIGEMEVEGDSEDDEGTTDDMTDEERAYHAKKEGEQERLGKRKGCRRDRRW